ncbi:alpha/beta fold hydrolase [Limnobacter sp.]|uniref:esterase/lipase family protein n=1 Tax=Limnobacter sp. TaxID=2003368 RepID=UPI00258AFB44|nr:alpha/beta fold hydrolase [Limnobacter sp.]
MHFFSKLTLRMFLLSLPLWLAGCAHFQDQSLGLPGLVNVDCQSLDHPPVILIHGTFANTRRAFSSLAPVLKRQGYCLYARNYGSRGMFGLNGMAEIDTSVDQLSQFTDGVLRNTGAGKVILVGHSQGGLIAFLMARRPEFEGKIDRIVAVAPSLRGTTRVPADFNSEHCPACAEQGANSEFMARVHSEKMDSEGVKALIIATKQDEVVTPVSSQFLHEPEVTNVLLQEEFPNVRASHSGLMHVPEAVALIKNYLSSTDDKAKFDEAGRKP